MKLALLISAIILTNSLLIFGQVRIKETLTEQVKYNSYHFYDVKLFGTNGLVLRKAAFKITVNKTLEYIHYDKNLKKVNSHVEEIKEVGLTNIFPFSNENLFVDVMYGQQINKGKISIVDIKDLKPTIFELDFPTTLYSIEGGEIIGNLLFMHGKSHQSKPLFHIIDLNTGKLIDVPIKIPQPIYAYIRKFYFDKTEKELNVLICRGGYSVQSYLLKISLEGKINSIEEILKSEKKSIPLNHTFRNIEKNTFLVTGSFSSVKQSYNDGVFIATIENSLTKEINYYNFNELKNGLPAPPTDGKPVKRNYIAHVQDLVPTEGGYYMAVALLRQEPLGSSSTSEYYSRAVIIKLDKSGKMKWHHSFNLNMSYYYKPIGENFIGITELSDKTVKVTAVTYNKIVSQKFDETGKKLNEQVAEEISVPTKSVIVRADTHYTRWYDNYCILETYLMPKEGDEYLSISKIEEL